MTTPRARPVKRRAVGADHGLDPALVSALATGGQRLTQHRVAVIETLLAASRPLTADEVVGRCDVPTSTAYRNLAELCDAGVVVRVAGADRTDRYEVAEVHTSHHHHHLVCIDCGTVIDFDPSPHVEQVIHDEIRRVGRSLGFVPDHHVFDVRGRCRECADQ